MKTQTTQAETLRSVAGALLVGLGLFLLFGHVLGAAGRVSHLLDQNSGASLDLASSIMLAASMSTAQLVHAAISLLWPLLVVVAGTILLNDPPAQPACGCPFVRVLCD